MRLPIYATVVVGLLASPCMVQAQYSAEYMVHLDPKDRKLVEDSRHSVDEFRKAVEKFPPPRGAENRR